MITYLHDRHETGERDEHFVLASCGSLEDFDRLGG
jgi:hypothetical protein